MKIKRITAAVTAAAMLSLAAGIYPENIIRAENEKDISVSRIVSSSSSALSDKDNVNFPEKFDLREKGLVSAVKDQGNFGTCWAFSSSAALETALIKDEPFVDLSEMHLSYFSFYGDKTPDRPVGSGAALIAGGHISYAVSSFGRWTGPVSESVLPYGTEAGDIDTSLSNASEYFISDAYTINPYSLSGIYPSEVIRFSDDEIKNMLMNENAVSVNIRYENTCNEKTFSQYDSIRGQTNHAVLIVGWDDSYSRDNFLTKPPGDGAWLAKNSWGDDWGYNGYFWISYYDNSLSDTCCLKAEKSGRYQRNYQHDTLMYTAAVTADPACVNSGFMANIFTAEEDESITAAALYTTDNNAEYEITVYTGLTNPSDPVSGTPGKTTSGSEKYAGYHTIELDEPVKIKKGETFSVTAKLTNPGPVCPIPAEAAVTLMENRFPANVGDLSVKSIMRNSAPGQSFISSNGTRWKDTFGMEIEEAYESAVIPDSNIMYHLGNVCLKALSSKTDSVIIEGDSGQRAYGSDIILSSPFDGIIRYTTDGSLPDRNSAVYTEPIKFEEDMTVTAALFNGGSHGEYVSRHFTQASSVLSSLTLNGKAVNITEDGKAFTDIYESINDTRDYAVLFPSGTGSISVNGTPVVSGHETEHIPLDTGMNIIRITSSEDGKKTTEYTLNIFRSYASVDYYNETILFNEETTKVMSEDGHVFSDGESISSYLGSALQIFSPDSEYTIDLTPRTDLCAALENLGINYYSESLNRIFSIPGQVLFSSSPDMKNSSPAENRLYPVLSDNYFKIYPDHDHDLYFQISASDTSPKSNICHISIPERPVISDDDVKISITDSTSFSFTVNETDKIRYEYRTEVKNSYENPYSLNFSSPESCSEDTTVIKDLVPGQTYSLFLRFLSHDGLFSSYVKEFTVQMPGEREICSFNYEKEKIIFDDSEYRAFTEDGTELRCYDSVSSLTGKMIFLTDSEGNRTTVSIPERPETPDIKIDYENARLTGTFDDSTEFVMRKSGYNYFKTPSPSSVLSDKKGIITLDKLYSSSYTGGDIIYFYTKCTSDSFASEKCAVEVPALETTLRNLLDIDYYTENKIVLRSHEGLEYGIREEFYDDFEWQADPVFTDLDPDMSYILAVRFSSTPEKSHSLATCRIVTTLSTDYLPGDLNGDKLLSAQDLVIHKKILLCFTKPDSFQRRASDINGDGNINIIDNLRLRKILAFL